MDNIIKRLCVGIILNLCVINCICELEHPDISKFIKPYENNGRVIDDIFKPERLLGEGYYGAVWKGIIYMFLNVQEKLY